jgi:hypothetical protein
MDIQLLRNNKGSSGNHQKDPGFQRTSKFVIYEKKIQKIKIYISAENHELTKLSTVDFFNNKLLFLYFQNR